MEIKITTNQILRVLEALSWVIFVGLCIEAGGIMFNTFYTFFINPSNTASFWEKADLSDLYAFSHSHFITLTITTSIIAVLKAIMFYVIVKLLTEKKLNITQPFSQDLKGFLFKLSYLAFGIGLFSHCGFKFSQWLSLQGVRMPDSHALQTEGADVWIFMSIVLFIIVQIIKKGIEIQHENDLTI